MKLEKIIVGPEMQGVTSLLEPRLEFGLLLAILIVAIMGLFMRKKLTVRNWRPWWGTRNRDQENLEMENQREVLERSNATLRAENRRLEALIEENLQRAEALL